MIPAAAPHPASPTDPGRAPGTEAGPAEPGHPRDDTTSADGGNGGAADREAAAPADGARAGVPEIVRRRLDRPRASLDTYLWSWVWTGFVVLIALVLRYFNLRHPTGQIFDELYYAHEGNSLLSHGVEWSKDHDGPAYVVHPPLGKWLIGAGIKLFGYNEFGWRISAVVAGVLSVLIITRVARLMFRSTVLGCIAGLLMALDGMHLVMSRVALLDIFLMFFIVAAFGAIVMDREWRRQRWLRALENGLDPSVRRQAWRVGFAVPWWRLLAFTMLGAALGVKWSAAFFIPAFILLTYFWGVRARRSAGVPRPWLAALLPEAAWLLVCGVLIIGVYIACWTGWLVTDVGWMRNWAATERGEPGLVGTWNSLVHYHWEAFRFHSGLAAHHPYQSWPWQWLLLGRPVAFHYVEDANCGAARCSATVLLLGTPALWWSFLPALGGLAWLGIARRDWRAYTIGLMVFIALAPWFYYALQSRTMFYFYALPAEPFLVLAVVYVLGAIMTPARAPADGLSAGAAPADAGPAGVAAAAGKSARAKLADATAVDDGRRLVGGVIVGLYLLLVVVCFAYYYPLYVGQSIPYDSWLQRMLLDSRWI